MAAVRYGGAGEGTGGSRASDAEAFRVYAVKYAEKDGRRSEHFLGGDPHDGPMPMDYFVWAVVGPGGTWVVDTGFTEEDAAPAPAPARAARARGARHGRGRRATVTDVVLTHLHYDHVGGWAHFPAARFHLQEKEMAYATGRHMARPAVSAAFTPGHVAALVHAGLRPAGRLPRRRRHPRARPLAAPAGRPHRGHPGRAGADGRRLAGAGLRRQPLLREHGDGPAVPHRPRRRRHAGRLRPPARAGVRAARAIVPGHDPLVLERYPVAGPGLEGIAVRLDEGRIGA